MSVCIITLGSLCTCASLCFLTDQYICSNAHVHSLCLIPSSTYVTVTTSMFWTFTSLLFLVSSCHTLHSYSLMKRNETCTAIFPGCFSPLILNPTNHLCFSACFVTSQAHWSRMVLSTHLRSALSMKTCIIRQWALWPANTSTSKPFASLITFFFPDWFSHLIGSLITLLAIHLFSFHSSER